MTITSSFRHVELHWCSTADSSFMLSRCATEDSRILKCLGDVELALLLSTQLLTYQPLFSMCIARAPVALLTLAQSTLVLLALMLLALALSPSCCLPSRCHPHAACPRAVTLMPSAPVLPLLLPAPHAHAPFTRYSLLGFGTALGHFRAPCVCAIPHLGFASQCLA